jgi:hypothetical protein
VKKDLVTKATKAMMVVADPSSKLWGYRTMCAT